MGYDPGVRKDGQEVIDGSLQARALPGSGAAEKGAAVLGSEGEASGIFEVTFNSSGPIEDAK